VEDGVTGFLVTPGDAAALADAVAELAADWQLRVAQGIAARRSMLSRTWPSRGDELIAHYEAVLGRTGMPGVLGAAA
jgi:phosphatidylinositol alpha 1,6-mannosyltransferase